MPDKPRVKVVLPKEPRSGPARWGYVEVDGKLLPTTSLTVVSDPGDVTRVRLELIPDEIEVKADA